MDSYTQPDPSRAALLTIDVQNDFTGPDAPAKIDGTAEALPEMERVVEAFRRASAPIVHVVRLYRQDGSNVDLCRREVIQNGAKIVQPGTDGAELVEALKPTSDVRLDADQLLSGGFQEVGSQEWILYKPRWSAFYETDLTDVLTERDVNTVVVCGCNFPNCPRATIFDASERDFRIVLVADATSGTYERGLEELTNIGVVLKDADETVRWLAEA